MSPQCETPCPSAEERRWWLLRNSFLLCSVSITRNRERIRMAQRKCGSLSVENTWFLGPACSSVLFLSRHILLSEACSTCDCGLRCKCDRNVGKDVRPVSFHINWGEPGKYLDALSGKDCQGGFLWGFSLHASSRRERDHIQSNAEVGVEIKTNKLFSVAVSGSYITFLQWSQTSWESHHFPSLQDKLWLWLKI